MLLRLAASRSVALHFLGCPLHFERQIGLAPLFPCADNHRGHSRHRVVQTALQNRAHLPKELVEIAVVVFLATSDGFPIGLQNGVDQSKLFSNASNTKSMAFDTGTGGPGRIVSRDW